MKQLGKLAIVCAQRSDVLLQIYDGFASVYVDDGPKRAYMLTKWEDDDVIQAIIQQLNYGKYARCSELNLFDDAA